MTTLQNLEEIGSQHTALTKPLQNPQLRWDNCTPLGRALKIITSSNNTKKIKKHHLQQHKNQPTIWNTRLLTKGETMIYKEVFF